jgi:hypothetical protein
MSDDFLSFKLRDKVLGSDIGLDNISLPLLSEYADQVARFLKGEQRTDLSNIRTAIKDGSLVLEVENEAGVLEDALEDYKVTLNEGDLSRIDEVRASVIEEWQHEADRHPERIYELVWGTRKDDSEKQAVITISRDTDFKIPTEVWLPVEKYMYGRVFDLGGKNKANVHLDLDTGTTITVGTEAKKLVEDKTNRLYTNQLVRISAEQSMKSKKLRNEKLISFENYNPHFDEEEFNKFTEKGSVAWASVENPGAWVEELRGNAE